MKWLLLALALANTVTIWTGLLLAAKDLLDEWEVYKVVHGKVYSGPDQENYRFWIYLENKAYINKHNFLASLGYHSYFLKMNHLGDLLLKEYLAMNHGSKGE